MSASPGAARVVRRDARRNRDALLVAAQVAFAVHGLTAPLEAVARDAGVSIGTLYRHFPTRLDLVQAVFACRLEALAEAVEDAATTPDTWLAFCRYLEACCRLQAVDRGIDELAGIRLPHCARLDDLQARILDIAAEIIRRAQCAGTLRPDVTAEDVAFVIWSQGRIIQATRQVAPDAWRRHLELLLDAFRAERATPLTEVPMSSAQLYAAMVHLGQAGPCADSDGA